MVRTSRNEDGETAQTRSIKAVKKPRSYMDMQNIGKKAHPEPYQKKKDKAKEKTKEKAKSKGKQTRDSTSTSKKMVVVRKNDMQVLVDKTMVSRGSKQKEKSKTRGDKRKRITTPSGSDGSKSKTK